MVGRLQGDALAAALFRNVATWCLGLAADWQADLYAAIVDVQWIDCRDGAVYKYGPYDASILVLAAAACVSHPPGEPMPPPWYSPLPLVHYLSLAAAGEYMFPRGVRCPIGRVTPWVERLQGLGFAVLANGLPPLRPPCPWAPGHDERLQAAIEALLRAAWAGHAADGASLTQ